MAGFFNQGGFFGGGFGGGFGAAPTMVFEESYRCYSMAVGGKPELESGDKVVLPPSALDALTRMHVQYPMMFRAESSNKAAAGKRTHVGVSEFTAPEGRCYFPHWIMQNLLLAEGAFIHIRNVQLPKARFVKLQPHSKAFIEISNPKAVLEKQLRTYSALTKGDTIVIHYAKTTFYLDVLETKPADAVSIIETDVEVDFAAPKDYVDPRAAAAAASSSSSSAGSVVSRGGAGGGAGGGGSASSPIVIDDDDDVQLSGAKRAAGAAFGGAGGLAPIAASSSSSSSSTGSPSVTPKFIGGSGTVGGGSASSSSSGAAGGASSQSLAAQAALRRMAAMKAAEEASGGPPPSKFAKKEPAIVPFAGTGFKVGTGEAVPGVAAAPVSARARVGSESKDGGESSPSVGGSFVSAGGAGGAAGARPGSAKPRTLNRFEQARAEKAFQGEAKTIRE